MSDDKKEVEKPKIGKAAINIIRGKPIIIILVIAVIVLAVLLIYVALNYVSQAYKIQYYNSLWNSSLSDLRNGTATVPEYCNQAVHDEELCIQFWNLEYKG